jgi:hypothetical protein
MGHKLSVHVHDSNHKPVRGAMVKITITGFGGKCEGLTNAAGEATIATDGDYPSHQGILISVRGKFRERSNIGLGVYRLTVDK